MVKVYKCSKDSSGIISSAEAKEEGISLKGCKLASIEDCKKDVEDFKNSSEYNPEFPLWCGAYSGEIKVQEGVFEFDFDKCVYEAVQ